jgi:protein-arginine kinase activator protein McsA
VSTAPGMPFGLGEIGPEDESGVEEEGTEEDTEQEELEARVEAGEACADCGEEFTEANATPSLCAECYEAAEDRGEKPAEEKSKFPLKS